MRIHVLHYLYLFLLFYNSCSKECSNMDLSERGLTAGKVNKIYTAVQTWSSYYHTYFSAGRFYNTLIIYYI